jgi:hypothetical protein
MRWTGSFGSGVGVACATGACAVAALGVEGALLCASALAEFERSSAQPSATAVRRLDFILMGSPKETFPGDSADPSRDDRSDLLSTYE